MGSYVCVYHYHTFYVVAHGTGLLISLPVAGLVAFFVGYFREAAVGYAR